MNMRKDGSGRMGMQTTSKNRHDNKTILYIIAEYGIKFNEFYIPSNVFIRVRRDEFIHD